jgi:hypothetical protein
VTPGTKRHLADAKRKHLANTASAADKPFTDKCFSGTRTQKINENSKAEISRERGGKTAPALRGGNFQSKKKSKRIPPPRCLMNAVEILLPRYVVAISIEHKVLDMQTRVW